MARYEFDGIDKLMAQTETDANTVIQRIERGLFRSGEILVKALREETKERFIAPTGELASKVKADRTIKRMGSQRSIEVYARGTYRGKRGSPRRAATVAFVQEYGRGDGAVFKHNAIAGVRQGQRGSKTSSTYWNAWAVAKSEKAIGEAIHEELFRK